MSQNDELQESIRLAVEAAEAANDTAAEITRLKADTLVAAEKINSFGGKMKPVLIGTLIGAVGSMGLAGLIYFRTINEMRTTAATQIEALTLFTQSVERLDGQLSAIGEMTAVLADMQTHQTTGFDDMQTSVTGVHELILSIQQEAAAAAELAAAEMEAEQENPMQSQMAATILDAVEKGHEETQAAIIAGNSDLQLALTRMLADGLAPTPQKKNARDTTTTGNGRPQTSTASSTASKPKPKPKPRPRPTAKAPSNPFSYP